MMDIKQAIQRMRTEPAVINVPSREGAERIVTLLEEEGVDIDGSINLTIIWLGLSNRAYRDTCIALERSNNTSEVCYTRHYLDNGFTVIPSSQIQ